MATSHEPPGATSAHDSSPLLTKETAPKLPLPQRLLTGLCLYSFKSVVYIGLRLLRFSNYLTKKAQPTFKNFYSVRPNLEVRVFVPPSHGSTSEPLPTYINIHGGGFALCDPVVDDPFCHTLCHKHNCLVISLSYSRSPRSPFPVAVQDITALIPAILADSTLPIDHGRVALGGFSAGGNLALAAAQSPLVGARLKAIVPVYPVVDFSGKYKGTFRTMPDGTQDVLKTTGAWFNWAYIPAGTRLSDPLLSPIYAERQSLPQRALFIGCEFDVLCHEAHEMAKKLAGASAAKKDESEDWEEGGVRWLRVKGWRHGFTHTRERGEKERLRARATEDLYAEMAKWLEGAFEEK